MARSKRERFGPPHQLVVGEIERYEAAGLVNPDGSVDWAQAARLDSAMARERVWVSPHGGAEYVAETYVDALEAERDALAGHLDKAGEEIQQLRDMVDRVLSWPLPQGTVETYALPPWLAKEAREVAKP